MPGTATGLRPDAATRLAALEQSRPEWRGWLALLAEVQRELLDDHWRDMRPVTRDSTATAAGTPLLENQTLVIDQRRLRGLLHRLVSTAAADGNGSDVASLRGYRPDTDEAVRLVEAAIHEDLEPGPLASIARLAAVPVLHACGHQLQSHIPDGWRRGFCPLCGAWPLLAERRGIDRSRWLRCGRCAAGWEVEPLWCGYCGERDHRKLGSLVLDGAGDTLKVDTCESCRGCLKSVAVLQAIPPFELLLQDLETVELDLVALDRGYARPEPSGFRLTVTLS